jgi:hypothetical protein
MQPEIRETTARTVSGWKLREIACALHDYQDRHRKLPPAVIHDPNGKPLYSWRVLLLPYVEEADRFRNFKLDEPWDSPNNKKLLEPTPAVYRLPWPATPPGMTHYLGFTGPGTAFERDGLTLEDDFPDDLSDTILVVEAAEAVPWSKPVDLEYDPHGPLPRLGVGYYLPVRFGCYELGRRQGFNVVMADASSRFILDTIDEKTIRGLITRNGGEEVDLSK